MNKYLEIKEILKKSIVSNPQAEIDINTAEQSQDELAAQDNPWLDIITAEVKDHEYGAPPVEVAMPEGRTLLISKVDEGLYSAFLRGPEDKGNETLAQFSKMTPEAMVQGLKAKEFLPRTKPVEEPKTRDRYSELAEMLRNFSGDLHIHLPKK